MRVVARVKTFLGDVRTAPIRSTRVGEFGVIACDIVCILGRVVADIVRAVVPVHTVNPFPHIAPQTLDTSPHDIDLAVRARRSASEIRNTVAGAGFQRTAVAVTVTSTDFALHIVVGELNQHEHLHSGECRNVNQAPTCALALGIGAELRSRLRHLRACAADGLVVGGGLVCADVGVVTLLASMIEQRVNGETSSGLVGDFDILHIPGAVTAIPELGDFHHHITRGEGFTHNALPRHGIVEIAMTCACTHGSSGSHADSVVGSRPSGGRSTLVSADTVDFHEGQLHFLTLPVRGDYDLLRSGLASAHCFHRPSADLVDLELISTRAGRGSVDRFVQGAGQRCASGIGDINGGGEIVVGGFVVRYRTCHRHFGSSVIRLGVPVSRPVLDVIGVTDSDREGSGLLRLGEGGSFGILPVRLVHAGDGDAGKCAIIVNLDGDIRRLAIGGSRRSPVALIGGEIEHALRGVRESGEVVGLTLGQTVHHILLGGVLTKLLVVDNQRTLAGVRGVLLLAHANHHAANGAEQVSCAVIAVGGFQKSQSDTVFGFCESGELSHVVGGLPNFLQNLVYSPFCFCPTHYCTSSLIIRPSLLKVMVFVFCNSSPSNNFWTILFADTKVVSIFFVP